MFYHFTPIHIIRFVNYLELEYTVVVRYSNISVGKLAGSDGFLVQLVPSKLTLFGVVRSQLCIYAPRLRTFVHSDTH